jgi:Leucine-rich repeat (LRR) protein
MFNQLSALPPLPHQIDTILTDYNQLSVLPTLPPSLTYLSCSNNQLTTLPSLPSELTHMYCENNPLEILPELPSTLWGLKCELPYNKQLYFTNGLSSEDITQLNQDNQEWMESQSMGRCMERCSVYYEELMRLCWRPERIEHLYKMGYALADI